MALIYTATLLAQAKNEPEDIEIHTVAAFSKFAISNQVLVTLLELDGEKHLLASLRHRLSQWLEEPVEHLSIASEEHDVNYKIRIDRISVAGLNK